MLDTKCHILNPWMTYRNFPLHPSFKCTVTYSRGRWCTWHGVCSLIGCMSACKWRRCCRSRWWQRPPRRRPSARCWPAGPRRTRCHRCWVCSCAHEERSHNTGISWSSCDNRVKKSIKLSKRFKSLFIYRCKILGFCSRVCSPQRFTGSFLFIGWDSWKAETVTVCWFCMGIWF